MVGCHAGVTEKAGVREPAVAGKFYPADAGKLKAAVEAFLADAIPARGERPLAIVAPHAGYVFSGQIAADAFKQAAGYPVEIVVILGTNHTVAPFEGVSVFQGSGYRTPLGVAAVDEEIARALKDGDPVCLFNPEAHAKEHSEEVQIPFVQVLFPKAKIVTAVLGKPDLGLATKFGNALARVLRGKSALIVASSDLSHYPTYGDAVSVDSKTLKAFATMDPVAIASAIDKQESERRPNLGTCACGEGSILASAVAAKALGAKRGIVLSYGNSGDTVFGDFERVVGYGAVAFTGGSGGPDTAALERPAVVGKADELSEVDKTYLLAIARKTIERYFATDTVPLPRPTSGALRRDQGCFVTLKKMGELRGCIGHMAEDTPLALTVAKMAMEAALNDRRFSPVQASEVKGLHIEISVMTPLAKVSGPEAVVVGRDGVVIRKGGRSAVFLPQVAPEQGWTRDQMLGHLCQKAGMHDECWKSGCEFLTFRAIVFEEKQ
jgi:AmmeMemoRadiSam system protein B/AmmeMemoRadiSam system protein A